MSSSEDQLAYSWRVSDQNRTAFKRVYADESKIRTTIQVFEQALSLTHENRVNEYPILVNEPGICKRLHKCRAAERNDVATVGPSISLICSSMLAPVSCVSGWNSPHLRFSSGCSPVTTTFGVLLILSPMRQAISDTSAIP